MLSPSPTMLSPPPPAPHHRTSLTTSQYQEYLSDPPVGTAFDEMPAGSKSSKDKPAFQFLTRSHPDDFKDDEARMNVRSHVMRDYRRKNSPANTGKKPARSRSKASQAPSSSGEPSSRPTPSRAASYTRTESSLSPTDPAFRIPSTAPSNAEWGESESILGGISCFHFERPRIELCASDDDAGGPFSIPTFIEPSLRFAKLCYNCLARLASTRDFPGSLDAGVSTSPSRDRIMLLASLASESSRRDLIMNQEGEKSQAALDFHAYTLRELNDNLGDPQKAVQDETIVAIHRLLMAEIMSIQGTDAVRQVHMNGYHSVVARQSGLRNLIPDNELVFIGSEMLLIAAVLFNQDPPPMHRDSRALHMAHLPWSTPPDLPAPLLQHAALDHTPDPAPSTTIPQPLHDLLTDMQHLTTSLLLEEGPSSQTYAAFPSDGRTSSSARAKAAWYTLSRHTPAANPRSADDWLYESCRLAGLIYSTAVHERIPLAAAGRVAAHRLKTPLLLEMLCSALYHSNLGLLWGPLGGALVWAALVAAAAANGSPEDRAASPHLLRRWLIYPAIACLNLLATPHADLFAGEVRTMLRVQRVLRVCEAAAAAAAAAE